MNFKSGNYITGKSLSRRTVLRACGAAIGIPLLDAMIPAGPAAAQTEKLQAAKRLQYVYMPMGCDHSRWTPGGPDLTNLPPILQPLDDHSGHINVLSNLELAKLPRVTRHFNAAFLSCAQAKHTESTDYFLGTTADQVAAKQLARRPNWHQWSCPWI